jgi:hypothetical protein
MVASRVFTTDPLTARQFEGFCDDADADGVRNDLDTCPKSNLEPTVAVGGYDSKVPNLILDNGCSISDGIEGCARTAGNHGQFVSCVASFSQELKSLGIISGTEMGAIQSCSAHARIP